MKTSKSMLAIVVFVVAMGMAQAQAPATRGIPQGDTWDSIKQLPNWSGAWQATEFLQHVYEVGVVPWNNLKIPFTEEAAARFEKLKQQSLAHEDISTRSDHCISLGVPGNMNTPQTRFEFLFTPGQVTIAGVDNFLRRIHTDGRAHFTEVETFHGSSIGHWEKGGVLVVETVALDPGNEFILGFPQGAGARVTERFYLKEKDLLIDEVTLVAPAVLKEPWHQVLTFARVKQPHEPLEYNCAQGGGRDIDKKTGKQGFDLSLPPDE